MLIGAPPGTHGTSHCSGWFNGDKFLEFLDHFIYHVKSTKDHQVLPLSDNHESHITVPATSKCYENAVITLTFPQHTSHKLQPLDRCVFGHFTKFYNVVGSDCLLSNPGNPISIYNVAHLTDQAYPRAFIPSNIQFGFCIIGLWPINSDTFTEDEFLSSSVQE